MEVYINEVRGLADCICSLYLSKRNIDREKEEHIRSVVQSMLDENGMVKLTPDTSSETIKEFNTYIERARKWGSQHHTLLKYMDFSSSVYGLHRAGQDDFDSHAERLDSRIVRSSTRLAKFGPGEKSEYYQGKIITTDEVIDMLGIEMPANIEKDGSTFVRTTNGYVREDLKDDFDVLRGLYMLSIPSNFIYKCNIIQFAHIVSLRDKFGHAAPEVKTMIEDTIFKLSVATGGFITRKFLYDIERWYRLTPDEREAHLADITD